VSVHSDPMPAAIYWLRIELNANEPRFPLHFKKFFVKNTQNRIVSRYLFNIEDFLHRLSRKTSSHAFERLVLINELNPSIDGSPFELNYLYKSPVQIAQFFLKLFPRPQAISMPLFFYPTPESHRIGSDTLI
jgi:hypothetical protein